jgi:hypothetical protein
MIFGRVKTTALCLSHTSQLCFWVGNETLLPSVWLQQQHALLVLSCDQC